MAGRSSQSWSGFVGALVIVVGAALFSLAAHAGPPQSGEAPRAEQGSRWQELKPAQQVALKPLEHEWSRLDGSSKQKWLALSSRFPKLTPQEQSRVQDRMTQWARLTPLERGQARLHYQEAKELPAQDREARWKAYQALSPEQKHELAARAAPNAMRAAAPGGPRSDVARTDAQHPDALRSERGAQDSLSAKSNIVPNPNFAAPPRAIAATVVQARPGATTTSITRRPMPPSHQQAGLPKIAGTPGFVNRATLLPQRGPQGAATRSAAAPDAERSPQR